MKRLIMVSNRLPVKISADGTATRTAGGLASALEGAELEVEQLWVGWPGGAEEDFADTGAIADQLREQGVWPVFLSQKDLDGFYEGYANSTLWPLLHYMVERTHFSQEWWEAYVRVNQRFADKVLEVAEEGDMIWVHDYHLFLLPELLRGTGKNLRVGFFLHTPFCSSEIFRVLPHRAELLRGLLGADVIGFHTHSYLRHFRSSLLRVLGLESAMDRIWHGGREVRFLAAPIGHNHIGFEKCMQRDDFESIVETHRKELNGKRLVLSVERLDYTKGVPQKLAGIRRFLENNPSKREEVVFVLISVPSRQGVEEYDQLTEEVQRSVGAINGDFGGVGHSPVQFLHRGFPPQDLAALYALSEVCLVTPLRDGMNLVAKEFLDCQREEVSGRPGVLILSELAGAAEELSNAIQVNPHNTDEVAGAIARALEMPDGERRKRIQSMQKRLRLRHSGPWAQSFVEELDRVPEREQRVAIAEMVPLAKKIAASWREGQSVGLFLDYDGTLRDFTDKPEDAVPDEELPPLLQSLAELERMKVAIVSGRPPAFLQEHLGGLGLTLVGEHGYRWLGEGMTEWELLNPHVDIDWRHQIREHLEEAALFTPGTHVEEKQSAVVWHYRNAEPEFGAWRARGLLDELTAMAANMPVTVHHGKKIVEVSSLQVSKGAAVDHLLDRWQSKIAFAAGDDQTDETMFALTPSAREFYTVKVGSGSTRADYRTDTSGVRVFLESLQHELSHSSNR
ncbi:bifunctional alpha,alpha-trehalose-phosphate synthase (UDP-forming)/trehalose-phosphatase [Roseibacillus ishigakijimensis]|uniref:Glucosylglycerol-phosphate synthase n=1 Tax=Roseibacillus ishigakijimensis TaxID=454146 RepID=A0A934VN38_9BACT|nr:bifunctional alpha,alpha-trehalose-phosphate synthase (UDP-forming)/trehalose-phosphatase [Roseibacillus ishigakijimensis]MBK1834721.1 bifunctional alpha,alpha-trehalose-phosphate synthase (UDP-forming)/trehalose-phosphatase [Roseibacillus ishigakijimensis]